MHHCILRTKSRNVLQAKPIIRSTSLSPLEWFILYIIHLQILPELQSLSSTYVFTADVNPCLTCSTPGSRMFSVCSFMLFCCQTFKIIHQIQVESIIRKNNLFFQLTLKMEGFLINSYCEGAVVLIVYTNHSSLWNKEQNPDKASSDISSTHSITTPLEFKKLWQIKNKPNTVKSRKILCSVKGCSQFFKTINF